MSAQADMWSDLAGSGTWNTEARRVVLLATELDIPLDRDALILRDVRELHALRQWLRTRPAGPRRRLSVGGLISRLRQAAHRRPLAG